MGKKYDAYEKAVFAEGAVARRFEENPSEQNKVEVEQAKINADFLYNERIMDPEG